jgi:hypothetical protein
MFLVFLGIVLGISSCSSKDANKPFILDMVHHNPGETPYKSAYNSPAVIKEMGYNGKVYFLFESPALAINWESVDADILPKGSEDRKWVDKKAAQIYKMHKACKEQGMTVFAMSDLMLFPKRLIGKYKIEDTFGDPNNELTERFLRAQINEVFDQFPLMDGLVVRIGETYLHDAPFHKGFINDKTNAEKTIIPLMNILREEICEIRNKQLIFRTWRAFDSDEKTYLKVSNGVEPHPNLTISIKHCEGDFHRSTKFSKLIGQGRHKQIIEVQCAREYEGKGAYPNYVLNGVINGFEEHQKQKPEYVNGLAEFVEKHPDLYAGVWTWSRGGGWDGPYIKNEMWCDLNAWVAAQWANNPKRSEEDIFNEYALTRLQLKEQDIPAFRKLCILSAEAVVRGRNSTKGDMNKWWTRDQGMSFPKPIKDAVANSRNLKQKEEAVEKWEEIVVLARSIDWGSDQAKNHAVGSSLYGLYLYKIYQSIINLSSAEFRNDKEALEKWIQIYDEVWGDYQKLPEQYNSLATLYTQDYDRHIRENAHKKIIEIRNTTLLIKQ